MSEEQFKLSRIERYFLSNQLRILEALYPNEADDIAVQREAVERGYEIIYAWGLEHIYDGNSVLTVEESREVWNTLEMYDAIQRSATPEQLNKTFAKFSGYDGNSETKFMAFSAFTIERLKRFNYLSFSKNQYYNSHMPIREIYGRMLKTWENPPINRRFDLTQMEVTEILDSATAR